MRRCSARVPVWVAASCAFAATAISCAHAAAPTLYRQPAYQSPVRGSPDDLLMLAGYGFDKSDAVVYHALQNSAQLPPHPAAVPTQSTADLGRAEVVSAASAPYSLIVRLPSILREGQTYALWVRNRNGEWSDAIRINDARPLWFSPAYVHESANPAARDLKVVGRNLQPANGSRTRVRLVGPQTVVLDASRQTNAAEALDHYVARVTLPQRLRPGRYQVMVSRDEASWIEVSDQLLEVRPDPPRARSYSLDVPEHGGCRADDQLDDVPCLLAAIEAAGGSGTVVLGPGEWVLSGRNALGANGIRLPAGVSLRGAGASATTVTRGADWNFPRAATFTLAGGSTVQGIRFRDARVYRPADEPGPMLRLGAAQAESAVADAITDVIIVDNVFGPVGVAIEDSGAPIERLTVSRNEFGAYRVALRLAGNKFKVQQPFRVDDSVIADNIFKPGSYLDLSARTGAMATEMGAGRRLDFSGNVADGASTQYLYSPEDPRGWRAAFFWHMRSNHEMVLVSRNTATCTGDKIGDGEAIAYDNNGNTFAFDSARRVITATGNSVTVAGPLQATQNARQVPLDTYYRDHWIQVGEGPGIGQARRIDSYRIDPASGAVTFSVSPAWDVQPVKGLTRIAVGREFWQLYTAANTVDHREPLCLKSNRSDSKAGVIGLWAQAADSVVEGNQQFDSDGILLHQMYSADDPACRGCTSRTHFLSSVEIRGNTIEGEYDWDDDCSSSGIFGSMAASPTARSPPLTVSYGLSVSHNTINRADGWRGGAIALTLSGHAGPWPNDWPLVDTALIHHNTLSGLRAAPARGCRKDAPRPRTGISVHGSSLAWRTVLYANSCVDAPERLTLGLRGAVRVCPRDRPDSCECSRPGRPSDVRVR